MLGKCMSIIDNAIYSFIVLTLTLTSIMVEIIIIYLIAFKKLNVKLILSYTNFLCFSAIGITTYYFTEYLHFTIMFSYVRHHTLIYDYV